MTLFYANKVINKCFVRKGVQEQTVQTFITAYSLVFESDDLSSYVNISSTNL